MRTYGLSALGVALLVVALASSAAFAADIVTVPTANQVGAGEIDVAAYYIVVEDGSLIPGLRGLGIDFIRVQTAYMGLTDEVEIDAHRYDIDGVAADTIWNASVVVNKETAKAPIVVVGGRDLSNVYGHASYFLSAAKTLNPPVGGPPTEPIIRLHLSLGTEDNTLFGEPRHEGIFGGVQVLLRPSSPSIGVVGLYDGQDVITGITFVPEPGWPTLKGGTFGGHWWVGINYTFNSK